MAKNLARVTGLLMLLALPACAPRVQRAGGPAPASASRIDTFRVAIPTLGNRTRTVRVYLPPGYAEGRAAYPVLYLHDAQNLFTPGLYGDWQVDETIDRLVRTGRSPGIIVVGIDNGPRRWDEYGPWVNRSMFAWVDSTWSRAVEGGEGSAYVDFLVNTLKPEIDRRYRTVPDRAHTGIGGSSMGGLISLFAGLTRPDVFSRVMAMSTAVWFAEGRGPWLSDNQMLGLIHGTRAPRDVRFYMDVGTEERSRATDPDVLDSASARLTYPRAYLEGSRAVAAALEAAGVPPENLRHVVDEGAAHNESAWSHRLEDALLWLFR